MITSTDHVGAPAGAPVRMSACGFGLRVAVLTWLVVTASVVSLVVLVAVADSSLWAEGPGEAVYIALVWGLYAAVILQPLVLALAVVAFVVGTAWVDFRVSDGATTLGVIALLWVAVVAWATRPSLIDLLLVFGIAVVLPLALGGRLWPWAASAVGALVALALPPGWPAAAFALPVVVFAAVALGRVLRAAGPLYFWHGEDLGRSMAAAYALVSAGALLVSTASWTFFGISEPIVELTAVHYLYAGCAALVLAVHACPGPGRPWDRLGRTGVALTAVAPLVVASGFVSHSALPQVGGAVLMTLGVWTTATLELRAVPGVRPVGASVLLAVSGLAVWVPMVLAIAWAAGQHWAVPALSIPDMARTHGVANAVAFVLCGLLGRRLAQPDELAPETIVLAIESGARTRPPRRTAPPRPGPSRRR